MGSMTRILGGLVLIMVAFLMFPMVLTGAVSITDANTTNLTGLTDIVGIAPTVVFIALLFSGSMVGWSGIRSRGR